MIELIGIDNSLFREEERVSAVTPTISAQPDNERRSHLPSLLKLHLLTQHCPVAADGFMLPPSLAELGSIIQQSEQWRLRSFRRLAFEQNYLASDPPVHDPEAPRGPSLPAVTLSEFSEHSINSVQSEGSNIDQMYI